MGRVGYASPSAYIAWQLVGEDPIVRPGVGTFAMSNLPPQMQHPYPGPGGGAPPVDAGPSLRERIARAKTLTRRAAGHWKMAILLLVIGLGLSLVAAMNSKRTFRSECSVQFKPGLRMGDKDDDSPSEKASKLMPKLQDELKTRARLEKVIREFNLYPKLVESRGMSDAVDEMRDKHIGFRGKGDSSTFVISFDADEDPELAQKVTQRLADTMIDEYTKGNLSAVTAQEAFLSVEEARSERELEAANKAFARFLAAHPEFAQEMKKGGTTPGAGGTSPIVMPTAVNSGDAHLEALKRQRARIEAEIKAVQTGAPPPVVGSPAQEARLAKAKRDREEAQKVADDANATLAKLRSQGLSDEYPDVKEARSTLTRAKASLTASDASVREAEQDIRLSAGTVVSPGKVDLDELRRRMDAVDAQIAARRAGRAPPKPAPGLAGVDAGPVPEPVNEIVELETDWQRLLRTLQESKEQHDDLNQKLERARLEKARAAAKGGDTMTILDPAYRPTKASKGGKGKVAMTGGAVAGIVALLYAFARVIFNDTMIDAQDIEALKLIPVLGVLPKIPGTGYGIAGPGHPGQGPPAQQAPPDQRSSPGGV